VSGAAKLFFANRKPLEILLRQVTRPISEITGNVAEDIRQLKRESEAFGKVRGARIAETENVQARQTPLWPATR